MQTAHVDRDLIPPKETRAGAVAAWPLAAPATFLKAPKKRIAFLYLGRRGGVARLAYELARAAETVVVLASHVWSPFIAPFLRHSGRRYVVIVHDAAPHPGDFTGLAYRWLLRDAAQADHLITLSSSVATALWTKRHIPSEKIIALFHPVMTYVEKEANAAWHGERPLRLLFFGRMMDYKGLSLLVAALEELRTMGLTVDVTVAGEGGLKGQKERLESLGVTVVNRWLRDEELSRLLATHDAVVLTHIEASQSGRAAAALGAGLPVITTPVGGLVEQVTHEVNGLVADRVDAAAIVREIVRIANDPAVYHQLVRGVARQRHGQDNVRLLNNMVDAIPWNAN